MLDVTYVAAGIIRGYPFECMFAGLLEGMKGDCGDKMHTIVHILAVK